MIIVLRKHTRRDSYKRRNIVLSLPLYILVLLFICSSLIHSIDGFEVEALDPKVWHSSAKVYWNIEDENQKQFYRPFLCHFTDVFIDSVTIFFKPKNVSQAANDLYKCCVERPMDTSCSDTSVHYSLCLCFRPDVMYVAAVASPDQIEFLSTRKKSDDRYLKGVTWLMNHYSFVHHPDHFAMKLLEVRGLMANRGLTNERYYSALPESLDQLVSMEYPLQTMTDYERFILKVVYHSLGKEIPYFTLNKNERDRYKMHKISDNGLLTVAQKVYSSCDHKKYYKSFYPKLLEACKQIDKMEKKYFYFFAPKTEKKYLRFPFHYAEQVYLSPRYKNNIPYPYNLTMKSFRESVSSVLPTLKPSLPIDPKNLVVAILNRIDGGGLRQILNFHKVQRVVQEVLGVKEIKLWYIDGTMSPEDQISYFRSFDIMIATHSSQLTNLLFAKNNAYVVEIQVEGMKETTFIDLAQKVGLNYYLLDKHHKYETNGFANDSWRKWDYYVNPHELRKTLEAIKMDIQAKFVSA